MSACLLLGLSSAQPSSEAKPQPSLEPELSPRGADDGIYGGAQCASIRDGGITTVGASTEYAAASDMSLESTKNRRLQVSALPRKEWSAEEDARIRNGVEQLGCRWRVIAAQLPGRSDDAVRNRWSRLQESLRGSTSQSRRTSKEDSTCGADLSGIRSAGPSGSERGAWSAGSVRGAADHEMGCDTRTEDADRVANLREPWACHGSSTETMSDHSHRCAGMGAGASSSFPSCLPTRVGSNAVGSRNSSKCGKAGGGSKSTGRKCEGGGGGQSSYITSHDGPPPEKKERTSWTRAEDNVIIQGVAELGHKWYEIARRLPGRTDHAIRNRWSRLQSIIGIQSAGVEMVSANPSPCLGASVASADPSQLPPPIGAQQLRLPPPSALGQLRLSSSGASVLMGSPALINPPATLLESIVPTPRHASLSVASLADVERLRASETLASDSVPPGKPKAVDGTSGGSEGSDAELTTGTAELLLLQSGGAPSCQPSPQITATARSTDDCPDMNRALPRETCPEAVDLLLLNKRPRV